MLKAPHPMRFIAQWGRSSGSSSARSTVSVQTNQSLVFQRESSAVPPTLHTAPLFSLPSQIHLKVVWITNPSNLPESPRIAPQCYLTHFHIFQQLLVPPPHITHSHTHKHPHPLRHRIPTTHFPAIICLRRHHPRLRHPGWRPEGRVLLPGHLAVVFIFFRFKQEPGLRPRLSKFDRNFSREFISISRIGNFLLILFALFLFELKKGYVRVRVYTILQRNKD